MQISGFVLFFLVDQVFITKKHCVIEFVSCSILLLSESYNGQLKLRFLHLFRLTDLGVNLIFFSLV